MNRRRKESIMSLLRVPTPRGSFEIDLSDFHKVSHWRKFVYGKGAYFKANVFCSNGHNMGWFVSIANKPFVRKPLQKFIEQLEERGYEGGVVQRKIVGQGEEISFLLEHIDEDPQKNLTIHLEWFYQRNSFTPSMFRNHNWVW